MRARLRRSPSVRVVAASDTRCDTPIVTTKPKHTRADLAGLSPNLVGELVAGVLYTSPRPAIRHAAAAGVVGRDLGGAFHRRSGEGGPGGWWILPEPELHLDDDVLVPDLAGWRRERVPTLPDAAAMTIAPDWVCEIVSPSTAKWDRAAKMPVYARSGVAHLWIVDPNARTLEVFVLHDGRWVVLAVHGDDERVRAKPFDAVELELAPWWDRGEPPVS